MAIQTVGLLSPGDMGHVVGQVLLQHGMHVVTCLQGRSERTRVLSRQADAGLTPKFHQAAADMHRFVAAIPLAEETLKRVTVTAA